uniref:Uncharacterized protein n=1 Tax=Anguilla anguilla TaxID=7936 RepID=A0A0E9UWN0_ANGAN
MCLSVSGQQGERERERESTKGQERECVLCAYYSTCETVKLA